MFQLSHPFPSKRQQCQHFDSDPPPLPKRADVILERSLRMVPFPGSVGHFEAHSAILRLTAAILDVHFMIFFIAP